MEVKHILKQLENIKQSLGNQLSSSTNHVLPQKPDYRSFLTMIYYNFIWKFEKHCFGLSMLKVTKCQAIQLKVTELQKFTWNVISQRDTAKN